MLCIVSPKRHSVVSDDKLPTFARSFEATAEALRREANQSLSTRVVPPRVVRVLSTDSVDGFCVAPSDASQLDTICNSAINMRHRFIRNKHRFLTRLLPALRRAVLTVSPLAQHLPVGARGRYCGYLVSALGWLCFGYAFLVLLLLAWFRGPPPAGRASSSRTDYVATCAAPAGWCQKALLWFSCVCAGLALLWARISGAAFGSPGSGAPPRLLPALRRAVLTVSPLAQHLPVGARGRYCGYLVSARGWLCFEYAFLVLLLAGLVPGPPACCPRFVEPY